MGLGALSQAGIVALTTEKLDIMVALVETEVEISPALRAFQRAGKRAVLPGDGRPFAACPLLQILHLLPGRAVYDGLCQLPRSPKRGWGRITRIELLTCLNPGVVNGFWKFNNIL